MTKGQPGRLDPTSSAILVVDYVRCVAAALAVSKEMRGSILWREGQTADRFAMQLMNVIPSQAGMTKKPRELVFGTVRDGWRNMAWEKELRMSEGLERE